MPMPIPKVSPVVVRVSAAQRSRWTAALEPEETLSSMVRTAVEVELRRRATERELEAERRTADPLGLARLDELLARARGE
jgi:hypothetical protein